MLHKNSSNTNLWLSSKFLWAEMGLMICLSMGMIMSLMSNNIFLVWVGLELKMFGMIPLLSSKPTQTKKMLFMSNNEVNMSFYYFFVQVVGSLLFTWGLVLSDWMTASLIGLLMKLGAAPFFWWVPAMFSRLDWMSMGMLGTIQKMPGLLLMRLMFDLNINTCMLLSFSGLLISAMGIKISYNKLKQLLAWSSMNKMSMLMLLMTLKSSFGLLYYMFYSLLSLFFCVLLSLNDNLMLCKSFLKGENSNPKNMSSFLLLIFSGLPPFISFLLKMYFLGGLLNKDGCEMMMNTKENIKFITFVYLMGSYLNSWNMSLMFLVLMTVQAIGYMKAFMKMNSTGSSRLSFISKSKYWVYNWGQMLLMMIYFMSLLMIWL